MKMKAEKFSAAAVKVTPDVARQFLGANTANRPLRREYVRELADHMRKGEWKLNGESIKFAANGVLLDGQHRLNAIIESRVAVDMVVVRGLESDVFVTIDMNRKRTAADALAIAGVPNEKLIAAAVRLILILADEKQDFHFAYSPTEIMEWTQAYAEELHRWIQVARVLARAHLLDPSIVVGLSYYFSQKDPEMTRRFWARLSDGMGLTNDDSVYILRDMLTRNATSVAKVPRPFVVAMVIRAWNRWRRGAKVKDIDEFIAGVGVDNFPKVE